MYPNDILLISQWESFAILRYFDHSYLSDDESLKDSNKSNNNYNNRVISKENVKFFVKFRKIFQKI